MWNINDLSQNAQNRRSGEKANYLFETYKNSVIPHGRHIYAKSSDMDMDTIFSYPSSQHAFPHWKCVFHCCYSCPRIDLLDQESDRHHYNTPNSIRFHIYHLITRCIVHVRRPLDENKMCRLCFQDQATVSPAKIYTRKDIVMIEKSISDFQTSFYIPEIQQSRFTFHTYTF